MDSIFNKMEKGKLYTVAGIESITVSALTGIDIMCDTESQNILVADEDRFDLDSPAGEVVREFVNPKRNLLDSELQVLMEVNVRPDGELALVGVEDAAVIVDEGWTEEDQEAEDFDEDGDIFDDSADDDD